MKAAAEGRAFFMCTAVRSAGVSAIEAASRVSIKA
jgi:hypothetical protein